jgi:predicted CXXCH cytochrome family protein
VLIVLGACNDSADEQGTGGAGASGGAGGEAGGSPDGGVGGEPFGLIGTITEPNGELVASGRVVLVPASEVEALAATPIDLFASPQDTALLGVDEPIEDLLDANGEDYAQADVDADGAYRFETLPEGRHFVVWVPDDDDANHLPGGDSSQASFDSDSLIGMTMDIRVSSRPSATASYLGSSTCLGCHSLGSTARTAHNVGLQVPGVRSPLQDVGPWPDFDDALGAFDASTDLFYYDCEPAAVDPSKCKVSDQDPGAGVRFELRLRRDGGIPLGTIGAYYVEMIEGGSSQRYDVVLTYGGALGKQQYLTRRSNANGSFSYFVLPLQYNYQGDDANPDSDDWLWRDYRSEQWFDFVGNALRQPDNGDSFDNNCAGCHFTGYGLDGSEADGWAARAIPDTQGAFDYDGDGSRELINTGCEACHGPGSEHIQQSPLGGAILSPSLLTPGRQAQLCGSCHSRPIGIGGGETGLPLSASNEMPPPAIRRAVFALDHTTRVSGAPDAFFDSGDPKEHYQQYSDHIRSAHYRNAFRLATCTSCHSPHANDADIADMDTTGNPNFVCTTCHGERVNPGLYPLTAHVSAVTGSTAHESLEEFFGPYLCTDCHMVPTAKSGASAPALDDQIGQPRVQYFWNDIASHRMTMVPWESVPSALDQPLAITNVCGECHAEFLPNESAP